MAESNLRVVAGSDGWEALLGEKGECMREMDPSLNPAETKGEAGYD